MLGVHVAQQAVQGVGGDLVEIAGWLVCKQPVFDRGASATDQSLIAARNSIVVENNYGHDSPQSVQNGNTT